MKILITSDTHGSYTGISDYLLSHDDIDLIIHAGDGEEDIKSIYYESKVKYYFVKGNNDFFSNAKEELFLNINNFKIFISHGHQYSVSLSYESLVRKAKEIGADIIIFGHTHKYVDQNIDGMRLLNPGSFTYPRDNNPGFLIMELNDDISIRRISKKEVDNDRNI